MVKAHHELRKTGPEDDSLDIYEGLPERVRPIIPLQVDRGTPLLYLAVDRWNRQTPPLTQKQIDVFQGFYRLDLDPRSLHGMVTVIPLGHDFPSFCGENNCVASTITDGR
jgi:hypothetical protein